jgi:hypothetical protein
MAKRVAGELATAERSGGGMMSISAKRKAAQAGGNSNNTHAVNITDISTAAQCARFHAYLQKYNTCTTHEARDKLNILHPAGRIMELRRQGHEIVTYWISQPDHLGRPHRVAQYVLFAGGNDE